MAMPEGTGLFHDTALLRRPAVSGNVILRICVSKTFFGSGELFPGGSV